MFKHEDIWRGIDRLALTFGYSPSGLAKHAGLDPTSFNKSKRISPDGKPRWPSTESISKILVATEMTMSEFLHFIDKDGHETRKSFRTIPLIGFAEAGKEGFFDEDGYPSGGSWEDIEFPEAGVHDDCYAIKVNGNSMEPLYRSGDILIVSPSENIRKGDRVIAKLSDGRVLTKILDKKGSKEYRLKSANEAYDDHIISPDEVVWMARIMWVSQ